MTVCFFCFFLFVCFLLLFLFCFVFVLQEITAFMSENICMKNSFSYAVVI